MFFNQVWLICSILRTWTWTGCSCYWIKKQTEAFCTRPLDIRRDRLCDIQNAEPKYTHVLQDWWSVGSLNITMYDFIKRLNFTCLFSLTTLTLNCKSSCINTTVKLTLSNYIETSDVFKYQIIVVKINVIERWSLIPDKTSCWEMVRVASW